MGYSVSSHFPDGYKKIVHPIKDHDNLHSHFTKYYE